MQSKVTTMGAYESRVNKEESGKSEDRYSLPDYLEMLAVNLGIPYSLDGNDSYIQTQILQLIGMFIRGESYGHNDNQMRLTIY
jgi:hypothetical protein